MAAGAVVLFAFSQMLFWHRVLWPGRRLAFTPEGILLPRHRLAVREDFVPYGDIERVWLETYGDEVTCRAIRPAAAQEPGGGRVWETAGLTDARSGAPPRASAAARVTT